MPYVYNLIYISIFYEQWSIRGIVHYVQFFIKCTRTIFVQDGPNVAYGSDCSCTSGWIWGCGVCITLPTIPPQRMARSRYNPPAILADAYESLWG